MDKGLLNLAATAMMVLSVMFILILSAKVKMLECAQVFKERKFKND